LRFSLAGVPFCAARNSTAMPVRQNTIISSPEKSIPPSTAKPPSMDTAAAASKKKYQVLRVNLSFMKPSPGRLRPACRKI